uniref:Uncharacterized protein n=1 Tax=Anopheles melas TaxID=34690 RepID=A0A182TWV6_9DIPT
MAQYYEIVQQDELKNAYQQINIDNGIQLVMGDDVQFGSQQVILSQEQPNEVQLIGGVYQTAHQIPQQQQQQQQQHHQQQHIQDANYLGQANTSMVADTYMQSPMATQQTQLQHQQQPQQQQQQQIYYTDESTGQLVQASNILPQEPLLDPQQTLHVMQTASEQQLHQPQQQQQQQQQQILHQQLTPPPQQQQQQQQHQSPVQQQQITHHPVVQVVQGIQRHGQQHIIIRQTDQSKALQGGLQQTQQQHILTHQQPTQVILQSQGTSQLIQRQQQQQQQQQPQQQQQTDQSNAQHIIYDQISLQSQ